MISARFVRGHFTQFVAISLRRSLGERWSLRLRFSWKRVPSDARCTVDRSQVHLGESAKLVGCALRWAMFRTAYDAFDEWRPSFEGRRRLRRCGRQRSAPLTTRRPDWTVNAGGSGAATCACGPSVASGGASMCASTDRPASVIRQPPSRRLTRPCAKISSSGTRVVRSDDHSRPLVAD